MLNLSNTNTRITASAAAVGIAMLACTLSAPRQALAQVQAEPVAEGGYIAVETPDRGTVGAEVLDPQSIPDGTRMHIRMANSSYDLEITAPTAESRVLERIQIFSGTSLLARAEALSDGTIVLRDATGAQFTGLNELHATTYMLSVFGPDVLLLLDERFQNTLYDMAYVDPDALPQYRLIKVIAAIVACCIKAKINCKKTPSGWDCSDAEVGWNCSCL